MLFIVLLLGMCVLVADDSPPSELLLTKDQMKVDIINNNHNHNNHKIEVHNEDDPYDCKRYVGDELKKRMSYLPKPILLKNLVTFSTRTRNAYEASLLPGEAHTLLQELTSQDREHLIQTLGADGKQFINALETKVAQENKRKKEHEEKEKKATRGEILTVVAIVAGMCLGVPIVV